MGSKILPDTRNLLFDYYYGNEAEQFSFIRVPKTFIKDKRFSKLSSDAKLLYGVLMDRMQLSIKNQWIDSENRVYIIYQIKEIMEDFSCSNKKAGEMLNDLHDFGLVKKVRRGQGKPDLLYVMNFVQKQEDLSVKELSEPDITETVEGENLKKESPETVVESGSFQKCNFYTSRNVDSTLQEMSDLHFKKCNNYTQNNTDINNTKLININPSIHLSDTMTPVPDGMDRLEGSIMQYRELIKNNIQYEELLESPLLTSYEKQQVTELYELICDVVCNPPNELNGRPREVIRSQFLKLNSRHVKYVISGMKSATGTIKNIRNYLIAALFNSIETMHMYYQQAANNMRYDVRQDTIPGSGDCIRQGMMATDYQY